MYCAMKKNRLLSVVAASFFAPMLAHAESSVVSGATPSTPARLDFRVIIPRVLFLAVGTGAAGTALTDNGAIDMLTFDYTTNPGAIGSGAAAAVVTGNVVSVRVVGNAGIITLKAATTGPLTTGVAGEVLPWSQITAVSSYIPTFRRQPSH